MNGFKCFYDNKVSHRIINHLAIFYARQYHKSDGLFENLTMVSSTCIRTDGYTPPQMISLSKRNLFKDDP